MRRALTVAVIGAAVVLSASPVAMAATLHVGPNQTYTTPCAAIAVAQPNDEVDVAPGTYTDTCTITAAGLTLKGVGGQPKVDLSGTDQLAQSKGIYVVDADNVTIENMELTGAHISEANGANGAGIRAEAQGLTVRGCFIHDNEDGILGDGTITVEYTEFYDNGLGPGCDDGNGCTHNIYIGNADMVTFRFNWSHHVATDLPDKGHLFKSRAKANYVTYNRITGEDGFDSYEIDLPNGGLAVIVGNEVEKGPKSGNGTMLTWGEEGANNPDKRVFVVANTFVDDLGSGGTYLGVSGAMLTAHDNIFAGGGNAGSLSPDNLVGVDPLFVDPAMYDYHLTAASPALGKAVDPGMVDSMSLTPAFEYVQPLLSVARKTAHDLGAFEFGTDAGGAGQDGGTPQGGGDAGSPDAGSGSSGGAGGSSSGGPDGGDANGAAPGSSGGCGCTLVDGASSASGWLALALMTVLVLARRLGRRAVRASASVAALAAVSAFSLLGAASCGGSSDASDAGGGEDAVAPVEGGGGVDAGIDASDGSAPNDGKIGVEDVVVPACDAGGLSASEQMLVNLPADTWLTVPSSSFLGANVCPNVGGVEGCAAVINDWSGGVFDPVDDKMIVWGGGHDGYWGNEVYTFDPVTLKWAMATSPSPVDGNTPCADPLPDGNPVSRHTYDELAYITHAQRMFAHGGAMAPCGFSSDVTWTLDLLGKKWTDMMPMGQPAATSYGYYGNATAYDPTTKEVFLRSTEGFQSYDYDTNTWTKLSDFSNAPLWPRYYVYANKRGAVDTMRGLFWSVGGGDVFVYDIKGGAIVTEQWVTTGGGVYDNSTGTAMGYPAEYFKTGGGDVLNFDGPAFDYDSAADQFVAWVGGAAYVLDLASKTWTVKSSKGAPPPPSTQRGVYGRMRYIARYNVFILVDGPNDDVSFYKNTAGCGS